MVVASVAFYEELRRALQHYEAACEAVAKARDEVMAFRDKAKQVRAETRRGPPNREQEKVATETWVRAEDRLNEMTSVLSKMVSAAKMAAGLLVDPETAEVHWAWGDISDPYAVALDPENRTIGRLYFARTPGGDHWICSYDLPEATRDALRKRGERGDFDREDDLPFDSL
jgi:hypothetical protein